MTSGFVDEPRYKPKPDAETPANGRQRTGASRGERLRGDHPIVREFPQFFAPADSADDEIEEFRRALNPPPPKHQPLVGPVKLRVLDGQVLNGTATYNPGDTLVAEGAEAQELIDLGACEIVGKPRRRVPA